MSKIDELIKEFCPNGVKFLQLGDVAQILNGYSFKSGKYSESGIRVVRISDVQKGKMSDKDLKFYPLEYEAEISRYLLRENDLVMSLTGNVGRVAMLSKTDLPAGLNQRVACIRPSEIVLTRWLFHFLDTDTFESDAMKNSTGGGQKNMSTMWLSKYKIPVPPLEVQKEIVNILDKFTQLEAELSAELEARRKQYEYYSSKLFKFSDEVDVIELKNIADFSQGIQVDPSKQLTVKNDGYVRFLRIVDFVKENEPPRYITNPGPRYIKKDGDLVMIRYGASAAGRVFINFSGAIANNMFQIKLKSPDINTKYLYYFLAQPSIYRNLNSNGGGSTMPAITFSQVGAVRIPVPSIEEQLKIVSIFEKFDALTTSLTEGLPAEIITRRKQYDYYRTKLLTFQESPA
ncbi:MAG: restriction endonuclease subunit S [Candidatus Nanogingivalis sp.]